MKKNGKLKTIEKLVKEHDHLVKLMEQEMKDEEEFVRGWIAKQNRWIAKHWRLHRHYRTEIPDALPFN